MADDEELRTLDIKVKQLKLDYDRYFLGSRPREPAVLRAEVEKLIAVYSNQAIRNSALRFRFSSICSRYQALKRQWCEILRQIESGTYARHRFKADLHLKERSDGEPEVPAEPARRADPGTPEVSFFDQYRAARESCGQDTRNLTPAALDRVLDQQREALRQRYGNAEIRFRVVIEAGRAKIKASPAPASPVPRR